MDRRQFLQVSGATLLAAQLPGTTESPIKERALTSGEYTGYVEVLPARRQVIFLSCHDEGYLLRKERGPLPPVGTVVGSDDWLYVFVVIDQADIVPSIAYVTSAWDEHERGIPAGKIYEGVVMTVEAIAPGRAYHDCNIRRVVSPQGKHPYSVCEAWRSEALGDWQAQSYAVDALYPADMQRKCGLA